MSFHVYMKKDNKKTRIKQPVASGKCFLNIVT